MLHRSRLDRQPQQHRIKKVKKKTTSREITGIFFEKYQRYLTDKDINQK